MEMASPGGNLLINGAFLPQLWSRLDDALAQERSGQSAGALASEGLSGWRAGALSCEEGAVACAAEAETFAADRWRVRYASESVGEVQQARSAEVPPRVAAATSLELRGADGLTSDVFLGQTIEADEAPRYRRELRFSAWCWFAHPRLRTGSVRLVVRQAVERDVMDTSMETLWESDERVVPVNAWTRLEWIFDASPARPLGLAVDLQWAAEMLNASEARMRFTAAKLSPTAAREPEPVPAALEGALAERFYQRHDARRTNAIGRALVCNPHELHFQFTFSPMRAFPAVSLPQDNADLTVFSPDGVPQSGFAYDVPHVARGSAIIRATKREHGLRDGYLAFRGYRGAITLEAEL